MRSVWFHPVSVRLLSVAALVKVFLRYRNPRRRRSGEAQLRFYHRMWSDAARALGAQFRPLGSGISEIELDGCRTRVWENVTSIDDPVTLAVAHDKPLVHRLLARAGLPVPHFRRFTLRTLGEAAAFMEAGRGTPCVVKPACGTGGGRGVTTGVTSHRHLARAAALASVYADELMVERQIEGTNYRLLYLDGSLIDAFSRDPPCVIGDGKSTVATLLNQLNETRVRGDAGLSQPPLERDDDMRRTLGAQRVSLRSVPRAGTKIILKRVVNENDFSSNTSGACINPAVVAAGATATRTLGLRFGGVDIITPDLTIPLAEAGGVILEVNGTPNLCLHYHKSDGGTPVAQVVLRRLLLAAVPDVSGAGIAPAGRAS